MEKIVNSKLFLVMIASFSMYLLFLAMNVVFGFFANGIIDIIDILVVVFGAILDVRLWTLYMGTVRKEPENPKAEKMTAFFTCQKVMSIVLAVLVSLLLILMVSILPYMKLIGDAFDKLIYEDISVSEWYEQILQDDSGQNSYEKFLLSTGFTDEELNAIADELRSDIANDGIPDIVLQKGFGSIFKIAAVTVTVMLALFLAVLVLFAIYMSKIAKFWTDFGFTWNGYAPWRRGSRYLAWLGYVLSILIFIVGLFGIFTIPADLTLLICISASVAMFCFAKFTSKIQNIMEELYRLELNV